MAEYHVKLDDDGKIKAGTLTKTGKWNNKSDVTNEAFAAVRDHLLYLIKQEKKDITYAWNYTNGKTLILKLEQRDTKDIQEGE